MAKRRSGRRSDGTRFIFWLNMLIIFAFIVLLVMGQWDFLLAGVLIFVVLNGLFAR
ncbi:MAG: hypothetical protein U9Q78_07545 [Chloroflexota bacterium]|nr:hypothetical protein [Chloroflexota bacterium]